MNTMFPVIDLIIRDNQIHRFQTELDANRTNHNLPRVEQLEKIIESLSQQKNKHDLKQEKINSHVAILKEKPYQKKWHYLSDSQKLDRLNLYFEQNNLTDQQKQQYLDYYEKNKLSSKELVYNNQTARIEKLTIKNI